MMRARSYGYLTIVLIVTNFIVLLCLLRMQDCDDHHQAELTLNSDSLASNLLDRSGLVSDLFTVIIRKFETFENDLSDTVKSTSSLFPNVKVFIVADHLPYPPLDLKYDKKVKIVLMNTKPDSKFRLRASDLRQSIKTKYVLIVPDSARLDEKEIEKMFKYSGLYPDDIIAGRMIGETIKCLSVRISFRNWTVEYNEIKKSFDVSHPWCDVLTGSPVILIPTKLFFAISHPFALPSPLALFIQTAYLKARVFLANDVIFKQGKELFADKRMRWKHKLYESSRISNLYKDFGIKKVVQVDGSVDWYGCSKETKRCFGTVVDDVPEYLYEGRWTPPCCLEALRITARHVFKVLDQCGVSYWLEGGSLLGAARYGDIIPWDYDVDIGIYRSDVQKCIWLKQINNKQNKPLIDDDGFIWERAAEGDFYRVQYSTTNRLHVDIFPFYSNNGMMTKDTWFESHKQDREFPENFLKPLSTIQFVGAMASAPNNIREFLEYKFGKGVIENHEYPNPSKLSMNQSRILT